MVENFARYSKAFLLRKAAIRCAAGVTLLKNGNPCESVWASAFTNGISRHMLRCVAIPRPIDNAVRPILLLGAILSGNPTRISLLFLGGGKGYAGRAIADPQWILYKMPTLLIKAVGNAYSKSKVVTTVPV